MGVYETTRRALIASINGRNKVYVAVHKDGHDAIETCDPYTFLVYIKHGAWNIDGVFNNGDCEKRFEIKGEYISPVINTLNTIDFPVSIKEPSLVSIIFTEGYNHKTIESEYFDAHITVWSKDYKKHEHFKVESEKAIKLYNEILNLGCVQSNENLIFTEERMYLINNLKKYNYKYEFVGEHGVRVYYKYFPGYTDIYPSDDSRPYAYTIEGEVQLLDEWICKTTDRWY